MSRVLSRDKRRSARLSHGALFVPGFPLLSMSVLPMVSLSAKLVGFIWIRCLPEGSPVFKIPYSVTGYLSHVLHGESTNSTVCPVRDRSLCPPCCATVQRGKPSSLNRYSHPVSPPRDAPCFSLHNCFLSKTTILWWSHVRSVARTSRL